MGVFQNIGDGLGSIIGSVIGFAIAITIFSLLNAVLLRWAAALIAKESPTFGRTFLISCMAAAATLAAEYLLRQSFGPSYLSSLGSLADRSPRLVPLLMFVTIVGVSLATFFRAKLNSNKIGFGKGFAIAAVDGVFLAIVGLTVAFGIMRLVPK